jgi:hypothetical protein
MDRKGQHVSSSIFSQSMVWVGKFEFPSHHRFA